MRTRLSLVVAVACAALLAACGPTPPAPTTTTTTTSTTTTSTTTTTLPDQPPTAVLSASTTSGVAHLSVDFSASGSTDADGSIVSWLWEFGDGNTSSDPDAQNLYTRAGSYTVSLTVTDEDGLTSTDTTTIEATDDADGRYVATSGTDAGACSASTAPCATVQYAVNQADAAGDTVYVDSGSYPELVHVAKSVDFKGANQGNPAGAEPVARRPESTVKGIRSGTPSARPGTVQRDISIDGMAVDPQGDTTLQSVSNQALVWLVGGPDTVVENSVFVGGNHTPTCTSTCAAMADNALEIRSGHIRVEDNSFANFRRAVNFYQVGFAGVTINSASFTRNSITGHTARGLQIAPSGQNKSLVGVTVEDNVFDATGYQAPSAPGSIVATTGTNTYSGNRFVGAASGIYLYICTGTEYVTGPQTVTGNEFEANGSAVVVFVETPTPCTVGHLDGTTINQNNFISGNNGFSMSAASANAYFAGHEPIDVTCNWWGVPTGPNSGGRNAPVHPSIVTSPWLDAPAPGGACSGT
jgi:PKD repeat protein